MTTATTTTTTIPDRGLEKVMALTEALQSGNTVALNLEYQAARKPEQLVTIGN